MGSRIQRVNPDVGSVTAPCLTIRSSILSSSIIFHLRLQREAAHASLLLYFSDLDFHIFFFSNASILDSRYLLLIKPV